MVGESDSGRRGGGIGEEAKAAFLDALHAGARREDAAAAAGFSLTGFYGARNRDPAFAAAWRAALAGDPAAGRRARAYAGRGEVRIRPANRRILQRRRRCVRFDRPRQEAFLASFAWSCDTAAAAAEAGVSEATVTLHCRTDPAFAAAFREALELGYVRLEAEAVRQRLAAMERLRAAIEEAEPPARAADAAADMAAEFERVMKLLARWDRKRRSPEKTGTRREVWTFESAIALLDERLRALNVPILELTPEAAAHFDGPDDEESPGGGDPAL